MKRLLTLGTLLTALTQISPEARASPAEASVKLSPAQSARLFPLTSVRLFDGPFSSPVHAAKPLGESKPIWRF